MNIYPPPLTLLTSSQKYLPTGLVIIHRSPFPVIHKIVVYFLVCLCSLAFYIANNMNPDQTESGQGS